MPAFYAYKETGKENTLKMGKAEESRFFAPLSLDRSPKSSYIEEKAALFFDASKGAPSHDH